MPLALDISNWGGELGANTVAEWKAHGVKKVIVGVHPRHILIARQQLQAASSGGLKIEVYGYLYFDAPIQPQIQAIFAAIKGLPVEQVWLDVEDTETSAPPPQVVQSIQEAISLVEAYDNEEDGSG